MNMLLSRRKAIAVLAASATLPALSAKTEASDNGVRKVRSRYSFGETVARLKADVETKGIRFFLEVDQAGLAEAAGIDLRPSTLLIFGNPPLGTQFITAKPEAGLDWPVRLLVFEDDAGQVWAVYNDFAWIAQRHGITDRDQQFEMASTVIASITSSVTSN